MIILYCLHRSVAETPVLQILFLFSWIMNQCDTSRNSSVADFILFRWIMSQCETSLVFHYKRLVLRIREVSIDWFLGLMTMVLEK
jgi:hypothetical protein